MSGKKELVEAFHAHLEAADGAAALHLLQQCTEPQRRGLAKGLMRRLRGLDNEFINGLSPAEDLGPKQQACQEVAFAILQPDELLSLNIWLAEGRRVEAIRLRSREWIADWARAVLASHPRRVREVAFAVAEGLCDKPDAPNWSVGFIDWLRNVAWRENRDLPDLLRERPDFLADDLWGLFEFDGVADVNLAGSDKYRKRQTAWSTALCTLSAEGLIPRDRLLDASLEALARDFVQMRAGWFSRFHEELKPTLEERAARVDRYLLLLGSTIPPTVSFAVKALQKLDKKGMVPAAALLDAIEPALQARSKATATAALAMLRAAHGRNAASAERIALLVSQALAHEHADVQGEAFDFLDALIPAGAPVPAALRDAIEPVAELVKPSLQPRLARFVEASAEVAPPTAEHESLRSEPVVPIDSSEELLAGLGAVLERPDDAIELERVLDGLTRLGTDALDLAALAKRARKILDTYEEERDPIAGCLSHLVSALHRGEPFDAEAASESVVEIPRMQRLLGLLIVELIPHLGSGLPRLSAPTDTRCWIAPEVLVERAGQHSGCGPVDQVLALLRLGPDRSKPDLARRVKDLRGPFAVALRHALAVSKKGDSLDALDEHLRLAAQRARDPWRCQFDCPAVYRSNDGKGAHYRLRREPSVPQKIPFLQPTVLLHSGEHGLADYYCVLSEHPGPVRWSATLAPGCTEDYFACGFERLDPEWSTVQWEARLYFEPLLFAEVPLGPNAARLLAAGLSCKEPGQWGMALDALLAVVHDGRFDAELLGAAFAELLPLGLVKCGRWAKSLGEAARASTLARDAVVATIQRGLRGDPADAPKDLAKLLELLHELLFEGGAAFDDPEARRFVEAIRTGGKTAKLCRALLAEASGG